MSDTHTNSSVVHAFERELHRRFGARMFTVCASLIIYMRGLTTTASLATASRRPVSMKLQKTIYSVGLMLLPGSGENRESSLLLIDGSNWHHVAYTCWQGFRHFRDYTHYTVGLQTLDEFSAEVHCVVNKFILMGATHRSVKLL
jgi:hypothetical protein